MTTGKRERQSQRNTPNWMHLNATAQAQVPGGPGTSVSYLTGSLQNEYDSTSKHSIEPAPHQADSEAGSPVQSVMTVLLGTLRVTQNWHWSETRVSTRLLKVPSLKDRIHGFLFRARCTLKHNSVRKKKKKKKPKNGVSHLCSLHPHFDVHEIRI